MHVNKEYVFTQCFFIQKQTATKWLSQYKVIQQGHRECFFKRKEQFTVVQLLSRWHQTVVGPRVRQHEIGCNIFRPYNGILFEWLYCVNSIALNTS